MQDASDDMFKQNAHAILAETDGLKVLEHGTYGYMMAVNAIERALKKCADALVQQEPVGHFINITEHDKPTHEWQQAAAQFKHHEDVVPLYRHPFATLMQAKPVAKDKAEHVRFRYQIKGTEEYSAVVVTSRDTAEATFLILDEAGVKYQLETD